MKNEKGFTLIEMLVVLLIISILVLVTLPNVSKYFATIDEKGCAAYVAMLQSQVEAYKLNERENPPNVQALLDKGYIKNKASLQCLNNEQITIENGVVIGPDKKQSTSNEGDDNNGGSS